MVAIENKPGVRDPVKAEYPRLGGMPDNAEEEQQGWW